MGQTNLDGTNFVGDWESGTSYSVGDRVQAPDNKRGYKCISDHTSGSDFDADSGYWVIGSFSGTDCRAFIEQAILLASSKGMACYLPSGKYRIEEAVSSSETAEPYFDLSSKPDIEFFGCGDTSQILVDEDVQGRIDNSNTSSSVVFHTGTNFTDPTLGKYGNAHFKDFLIKSRWTHYPGTNNDGGVNGTGHNFFVISEYSSVKYINVTMTDARQKCTRDWFNNNVELSSCVGKRLAKGMFRQVNSSNIICTNNRIYGSADDSLDFVHAVDDGIDVNSLAGNSVIVSGNLIEDGEGIIVSGYRIASICWNIIKRPHDTCITVVTNDANENPTFGIKVSYNQVFDGLRPIDYSTGEMLTSTYESNPYITIKGGSASAVTTTVKPGNYDSDSLSFIAPYDGNDQGSYLHTKQYALDSASKGMLVTVSGNTIAKTLPSGVSYSEWLVGMMYSPTGYYNPTVTDENRLRTAIYIQDELNDCDIINNKTLGIETSVYLYATIFDGSAFGDVKISGNDFKDFHQAFSHNARGGPTLYPYRVTISDNVADGDPYHKSEQRTSPIDGSWSSGDSVLTDQCGFRVRNLNNAVVKGNTFRNCLYPIVTNNLTNPNSGCVFVDNTIEAYPIGSGYNSGNKGAGYIFTSELNNYRIIDSDPNSSDYGSVLNICPVVTSGMPTSGVWVKGAECKNINVTSGGVEKYIRATTGDSHVLGTDWFEF